MQRYLNRIYCKMEPLLASALERLLSPSISCGLLEYCRDHLETSQYRGRRVQTKVSLASDKILCQKVLDSRVTCSQDACELLLVYSKFQPCHES